MVVKVLKVKNPDGAGIDDKVAVINKNGSFLRVVESNENLEKLIKKLGTPFYMNIVPTKEGYKCTGIVRGDF